jgi:hypothetical protein
VPLPDSTTQILKRVAPGLAWLPRLLRDNLTPAGLIGTASALAVAVTWIVVAQHDIIDLKDRVAKAEADHELLVKIDSKLDTLSEEMGRLRDWRERIEEEAETQPHVRKRKP